MELTVARAQVFANRLLASGFARDEVTVMYEPAAGSVVVGVERLVPTWREVGAVEFYEDGFDVVRADDGDGTLAAAMFDAAITGL